MGIKCLFGHKWEAGSCVRCGVKKEGFTVPNSTIPNPTIQEHVLPFSESQTILPIAQSSIGTDQTSANYTAIGPINNLPISQLSDVASAKGKVVYRGSKDNSHSATNNRSIRVFISSTFRDMIAERDELMTHVWPELRRFCKELHVELVEIDLRWGITEEESTRNETLKLCLNEIHSCRPYFIGILGERYGWVPGEDVFTTDLNEEQSWLNNLSGKSVTELEILHGVLNNPEMAERAFFYFRDPQYVESISEDKKNDFLAENPEAIKKQTLLKDCIRKSCALNNISLIENYSNPQSLAPIILQQLKDAIDKQFPKESIPDLLTREDKDHEAFAEKLRHTYIVRQNYFEALNQHVTAEGRPLLVLGDSGSGKSALLANWIWHWRQEHPKDFIFQHYIGGTTDSADHWKLLIRLIAVIKRWTNDPEEQPRSHEDIFKTFPIWLAKAKNKATHEGIRFILVLDSINQLEDHDHARQLGWLAENSLGESIRLIVSTLPGDTLSSIEKRGWIQLNVEPLKEDERYRMIVNYLAFFGKKLDEHRLERLASAPATANPLYLKILLDDLRITGTYDQLDERLTDYLAADNIPALLQKVFIRYQHDYERDRKGLVAEVLGFIYAARRGLSETELMHLLRPANRPQLPSAVWSPLRAALEYSLVDRGGILNFAHDFFRKAVEDTFILNEKNCKSFRLKLTDYFETQPINYRTSDECPWLLSQTKNLDRLRAYLLNVDCFLLIQQRDEDELYQYWLRDLHEENTMGDAYLETFNLWAKSPELEELRVAYVANQISLFLLYAGSYSTAESLLRLALEIHERNHGSTHANLARNIYNLSIILKSTNRLTESELLMQKALKITEQNYGPDHQDVAIIIDSISQLLRETNRPMEAEPLAQRALKITEQNYGQDHPEIVKYLINFGLLLQYTNRLTESETYLRRALNISEHFFGDDHPYVAFSLNNLALILNSTNRLDEAELLMRQELSILEKHFGSDHQNLAPVLNNLGALLHKNGHLPEAASLLKRALDIVEKGEGINNPTVATKLNNLANLFFDMNQLAEAEQLVNRALMIREESYGPNHPDVATCLNTLAGILRRTDRKREAAQLRRRAVKIVLDFTRATGYEHPYLRLYLTNYVELLLEMKTSYDEVFNIIRSMGVDLYEIFMDELEKMGNGR